MCSSTSSSSSSSSSASVVLGFMKGQIRPNTAGFRGRYCGLMVKLDERWPKSFEQFKGSIWSLQLCSGDLSPAPTFNHSNKSNHPQGHIQKTVQTKRCHESSGYDAIVFYENINKATEGVECYLVIVAQHPAETLHVRPNHLPPEILICHFHIKLGLVVSLLPALLPQPAAHMNMVILYWWKLFRRWN